jgi:hypothetical protein
LLIFIFNRPIAIGILIYICNIFYPKQNELTFFYLSSHTSEFHTCFFLHLFLKTPK